MKKYLFVALKVAVAFTVVNYILNKVYEDGYSMGRLANSIDAAADCREAMSQCSCPKR